MTRDKYLEVINARIDMEIAEHEVWLIKIEQKLKFLKQEKELFNENYHP